MKQFWTPSNYAVARRVLIYLTVTQLCCAMLPAHGIEVPKKLKCQAEATAGLHDYPHNQASYEPVVFYEGSFELRANTALNRHLAPSSGVDAYFTMAYEDKVLELACAHVRGNDNQAGLSCRNDPPSEFVLLNLSNLRFTRTAIGGWTFANDDDPSAPDYEGDSLFVEYGQCVAD